MLAVIAPEPAPWIVPLLAAHAGPAWLFAPWDLTPFELFLARVPAAAREKLTRFTIAAPPRTHVRSWPGFSLCLAGSRVWARGHVDRQLTARFALRAAVDAVAARLMPDAVTHVVAPSCAARRSFARCLEAKRTLVHDLPVLRSLHRDLDGAARAHPESAFLRNFRASHAVLARQEAEWALASSVQARGGYARRALLAEGCPAEVSVAAPTPRAAALRRLPGDRRWRLLLAGFAAARSGTYEALALLDMLPQATLLVRAGEGMEPADLLDHPRVRRSTARERDVLEGVHAVLAPAWCESHSPEVSRAIARGVPVIATERGSGAELADVVVETPAAAALLEALGALAEPAAR